MSDEHVSSRTWGCNKVCYGSLSCISIERMSGVLDRVRRQRRLSKSTYNRSLSCESGWFLIFWSAYWYEIILPVVFYDWYEQQLGFWSVQLCHLLWTCCLRGFHWFSQALYRCSISSFWSHIKLFDWAFTWSSTGSIHQRFLFQVKKSFFFFFFFLQSCNFLSMKMKLLVVMKSAVNTF